MIRSFRFGLALVAMIALSAVWVSPVAAQEAKGRCKIHRVNGKPVTGEVKDVGDAYEVTVEGYKGIVQRIPKTEVAKLEVLEPAAEPSADRAGNKGVGRAVRIPITDAIIEQIIGSEHVESSALDDEDTEVVDVMAPLLTNERSVSEMMVIAGAKAKRLETAHFIFVYTSELELAQSMAAKLERIYRWIKTFNDLMGVRSVRPDHRLEIFFFGTHKEYEAYQSINGFVAMGAIGFYQPKNNRSAFFNMHTWPPVVQQLESLKGAGGEQKREIQNRIDRRMKHLNQEVVQHEAAHHIHFNMGTFAALGNTPRWAVEGLAQMFEVVESDAGASLGALNHARLYQFRQIYGNDGERIPDMRIIILNDGWWFQNGANAYPMGWALNQYLLNKHRDKYKRWCQLNSNRESRERFSLTDRQRQFEELFGDIDEEWTRKFVEYMKSLQLKMEHAE